MTAPIAIIAGAGDLPKLLVSHLQQAAQPYLLAELDGFASGFDDTQVVTRFRIERLALFFDFLHDKGVKQVVFAGAVHRPRLEMELFDPRSASFVPRIAAAMQAGDDAALRAVLGLFEDDGFAIVAAHDVAPELLPGAGVLTTTKPTPQDIHDATRAMAVIDALGGADVGQGAVVQQGQVLAVEALPGTDWMLARLADAPFAARPKAQGGKGVFAKAAKPGQDRRVDLPAIGPHTIAAIEKAGLGGIAIAAGQVMIINRDATIAAADNAGVFLWVREAQ